MRDARGPLALCYVNSVGLDNLAALAPGRHWLDNYNWHVNYLIPLFVDKNPLRKQKKLSRSGDTFRLPRLKNVLRPNRRALIPAPLTLSNQVLERFAPTLGLATPFS